MALDYVEVDEHGQVKKKTWREKLSDGLHNTADWIRDNQELTVVLAPIMLAGLSYTGRIVHDISKIIISSNERKVTDRRCYDPCEGHYWTLKRKLSNKDWLEIQRRESYGERLGDILADMKVLKR